MIWVIYGGAASGKSNVGENLAQKLGAKLLYVAAMKNENAESDEKVQKHKTKRFGKGFNTFEKPIGLSIGDTLGYDTILIECMSNWVANEMFGGNLELIHNFIKDMQSVDKNFVIISNDIFCDGLNYEPSVIDYMKTLASFNLQLAAISHVFIEVIAGQPLCLKGAEIYAEYC